MKDYIYYNRTKCIVTKSVLIINSKLFIFPSKPESMTGKFDKAPFCNPQKIHKPQMLDPKKYTTWNFEPQKIQDLTNR